MVSSEVVYFQRREKRNERITTMRLANTCQPGLVLLLFGCASPRPPQPGAPTPVASIPIPTSTAPSSWTLSLTPGVIAYRISRSGVIEIRSDSGTRRESTANSSHETITLQQLADTIDFTAVVDTFLTTVRVRDSTQQPVALPFHLSGQVIADTIRISPDSSSSLCSPVRALLVTDLHNLLPRFPNPLSTMSSGKDSTDIVGCLVSIPIRSHVSHSYTVVGEISYENTTVLVIQRTDSIRAEGEGAQQQHRVVLTATGTGEATYYMDTATGHVVHLVVNQDVDLTVSASGRTNHFRQNAKQEFTLVR